MKSLFIHTSALHSKSFKSVFNLFYLTVAMNLYEGYRSYETICLVCWLFDINNIE